MIGFFGCRRVVCIWEVVRTVVVTVAVSMGFVCLLSTGCKKRETSPAKLSDVSAAPEKVYTNRMNDASYVDALIKKNRRAQQDNAFALRAAVDEMNAQKEKVKATLPEGADEAALEKALAKDEVWQRLNGQVEKAQKDVQQMVEAAREKVRQGLVEEARARTAVAEGKAKAVDQVITK